MDRYEVSLVPRRLIILSNALLSLVFEAFTVAFDNFTVPSRTMEPSSFAAFTVAALRRPVFSTRTVQRQYSLAARGGSLGTCDVKDGVIHRAAG
jgi:hypothetical protein